MSIISLHKKVAIISGGTGYLGSVVAKTLSHEGMMIAVLYHRATKERVSEILSSLSGDGHKAYLCDLTNEAEVKSVIETIEQELGSLFLCVHAAGEKPVRKKLLDTSQEEMRSQIDSTVLSGFNFLSSCAKRLKEYNNGVLIGITTAGVVIPEASKTMGAYIPAKFALQGMLSMFKQELSQYRVGVYSLAPGFMAGGMNSAIPKAFVEILKNKSPSKLLTIPEDVAREIVSLASAPFEEHHTILTITLAPEFE